MSSALTRELAEFAATHRVDALPESARHEAERTLLNWMGCALGGANDPAVQLLENVHAPLCAATQCGLIGRAQRCDAASAALINAVASNILDFDDTHLATVIHPTVAIAPAVLALAEWRKARGEALLHALALGSEIACRVGLAVSPGHYESGWHITATCGVLGAALACGRLLALDTDRMSHALGIAATQASGLTGMLGSQSKSLNFGAAARNGLQAALLAQAGFTAGAAALEGRRGFLAVLGPDGGGARALDALGTRWEIERVACKPYPCGIVVHPVIDACARLKRAHQPDPAAIRRVAVRAHPLVLELTGRKAPRDGLEGKLSVYHCAAVALIDGAAGVAQFADARVLDPAVVALRECIEVTVDASCGREAAEVVVELADGTRHERKVKHAIGSLLMPMSDEDLAAKFRALAREPLGEEGAERLLALMWNVGAMPDAGALVRASLPARQAPRPDYSPRLMERMRGE